MKKMFLLWYVFLAGCNFNKDSKEADDYITVVNKISPIIADSAIADLPFEVFLKRIYQKDCPDYNVVKSTTKKFKIANPVIYSNLKVEKNYDPTRFKYISFLNDTEINVGFGLTCLPRILCRTPPCPPETRPIPYIKINFTCKASFLDTSTLKTKTESFKSSTRTIFITNYSDYPNNSRYKVVKFAYTSLIRIFKNGELYREYELDNEHDQYQKVISYNKGDKQLVVEIIE